VVGGWIALGAAHELPQAGLGTSAAAPTGASRRQASKPMIDG
jgi:hypothetical protein